MSPLEFNLQIELFTTLNDDWEDQDTFYCVFNSGFFRDKSSGNCFRWEDNKYYYTGKVEKNDYNSYDLVSTNSSCSRTEEEALTELSNLQQ